MNKKYFIFLAAALTTFTAQCMNEDNQLALLTNDKNSLTIQDIKNKRNIFIAEIDAHYKRTNMIYFKMAQNPYGVPQRDKVEHSLFSIPFINWPNFNMVASHALTYYIITSNNNSYLCSLLGAATLDYPDKTQQQKQAIIEKLTKFGNCQPTAEDKKLAFLEHWERLEACIPKIMLLRYFLYSNDILEFPIIPQDLLNYIALLTFNLEEPLF